MSGVFVLVELAGAVALLLWATRMVHSGVQRAFGHVLKEFLRCALTSRLRAAAAGAVLAMTLQSATAVAVIVTGFVGAGVIPVARGVGALLGADFGSALIALVLQIDLSLLMPLLLLAGLLVYRNATSDQLKQTGRIFVGVGLILLSLQLIGGAAAPLRNSTIVPQLLQYLADDRPSVLLVAAVFTFVLHSSIAAVLVLAAMGQQGLIPAPLVLPLVLGLNIGASVIPVYLTRGQERRAKIAPLANLILRGGGAILAFGLLLALPWDVPLLVSGAGQAVVFAHVGFNGLVMVAGVALAAPLTRVLDSVLTPKQNPLNPTGRSGAALNEHDLNMPAVALSNAQREMMVICDRIEIMVERVPAFFEAPRLEDFAKLRSLDDEVDGLHTAIKLYIARIPAESLDPAETDRADQILGTTIKLEQIGDIITRDLVAKAEKKFARGVAFSAEGWKEILEIHSEVYANTRRAFSVFLSGDVEMARMLVRSKERLRKLEQESEAMHLQRLRLGDVNARETSTLHMDMIRDLKEINSLLVAITYPVLEREGMLSSSRLRD
jgi:phosphate:Na+ symporter